VSWEGTDLRRCAGPNSWREQHGGLHPTAAFERLRHYVRSHNVKLAELARRVVDKDLNLAEILRSGQPPHPPQTHFEPNTTPGR
jgi:hypothetical protein